MTREELSEECEWVVRKYLVALQDDWRKALPRLMGEWNALYDQYEAAKVPAGPPEPEKPATTPRRARK